MYRKLRGLIWLLVFTLASPLAVASDEIWMARANGQIDIAADGSVAGFELAGSVGAEVDELIQRQVDAWRFEPVIESGQAVPVQASVYLKLHAVPSGGRMQVHVADARFYEIVERAASSSQGDGSGHYPPPRYPNRPHLDGVMAEVITVFTVDMDGKMVDADVERIELQTTASMRGGDRKRYLEQFERSVLSAASEWRFRTDDLDFSKTGVARVRMPVTFNLDGLAWGRLFVDDRSQPPTAPQDDRPAIADLDSSGGRTSPRIALLTELQAPGAP